MAKHMGTEIHTGRRRGVHAVAGRDRDGSKEGSAATRERGSGELWGPYPATVGGKFKSLGGGRGWHRAACWLASKGAVLSSPPLVPG